MATPEAPKAVQAATHKDAPSEQVATNVGGMMDWFRRRINSVVANTPLPSKEGLGYDSTQRVYGASLVKGPGGKLLYDKRGIFNRIDVFGDGILRTVDDNQIRRPLKMLLSRPRTFMKLVFARGKRYRGSTEEILANVKRLKLDQYYGPTKNRRQIEVKDPQLYTHGIAMQDIYRQDTIGHDKLKGIDRFDALKQTGAYLDKVHKESGAVGEFNLYHMLFREKGADGKVGKPVQTLPDIVWNPARKTGETDKKATDFLDLLASTACEEYRRSKDPALIAKALDAAASGYNDTKIVEVTASFARRGRLTLPRESKALLKGFSGGAKFLRGAFGQHNVQRLGIDKNAKDFNLRDLVIAACDRRVAASKKPPSPTPTPAK